MQKYVPMLAMGLVALSLIAIVPMATANTGIQNIYGNTATVTYGEKDLYGITVAWVKSKWTFGIDGYTGKFILNNKDTFLSLDTGGIWPDGGSWKSSTVSPSSTALNFHGEYVLSGPFNSVTGTMYNNVVYHPDDGTYMWYRGAQGVYNEVELPFPPIDVDE